MRLKAKAALLLLAVGAADFVGTAALAPRIAAAHAAPGTMVVTAMAAGLALILAGWLAASTLTRPLGRLADGLNHVAAGDLGARVEVASQDELGQAAAAFNAMADALQARSLELEQTTQTLRQSNAELERFAYVASHDLQEPVRMVANFTDLLAKRYADQLDAEARDYLGFASGGAKRMQKLIGDLLEYSRIGTAAKPLHAVPSQDALDAALANLALSVKEANATIQSMPLPEVIADPPQLARVFQNLVGNAIKFHGPAAPRVEVGCALMGGEAVFSVKDNGIGIDPQHRGRLFELFHRLHTRDEYPGSGIGLAVSKRIVERHGGRIWMESRPGEGSTFYFTLHLPAAPGGLA